MFLQVLTAPTRELLERLGNEPLFQASYLASGTAAALHLGHRVSIDLYFFSDKDCDPNALIQQLGAIGQLTIQQQSQGTFIGLLSGVQISFFYYPYPLMEDTIDFAGVRVAALLDIALMKLIAISQRGTRRDFVDLYFLCHRGYQLEDLLKRIPDKYTSVNYPSYHILRALTYFEDAEREGPLNMLADLDWDALKKYFEKEVKELGSKL